MFRVAVITLSDTGFFGKRTDRSGDEVKALVAELGTIVHYEVLPDDIDLISETLARLCDGNVADVLITTGGTGFSCRDVTPEATRKVIEREVPGLSEYMRMKSAEISSNAILSRGVSGIRNRTLIINLPGSTKAVRENLALILPVLPHALEKLAGDTRPCGG